MSELDFLSPALVKTPDRLAPRYRSPLERALVGAGEELRDLSETGKLEVRGDIDAAAVDGGEVVRITARRALVLCDAHAAPALAARLRAHFDLVIDRSAALAGLAVRGEQLLRRLTDLDLDTLPAVGAVAGVQCTLLRSTDNGGEGDEFQLFFAQEYADHVAAVVLDTAVGLR